MQRATAVGSHAARRTGRNPLSVAAGALSGDNASNVGATTHDTVGHAATTT
ncbi:hypothetical protein KC887_02830 [Candidatus Kaiserbacteria bacterium]|nr:hypothetical protein [Candidatus Kaiserbacteria bacterium]